MIIDNCFIIITVAMQNMGINKKDVKCWQQLMNLILFTWHMTVVIRAIFVVWYCSWFNMVNCLTPQSGSRVVGPSKFRDWADQYQFFVMW
jgi:hypothetical protein